MPLEAILPLDIKAHTFGDFQHKGGREEGPGPVAGPSAEGFRVRAGRGDGRGLHADVFCQVELSKRGYLLSERFAIGCDFFFR